MRDPLDQTDKLAIDKEWLILITIAKKQGLTAQQVREFLVKK